MCLQSVWCARGETDKTVIHIKSILDRRHDKTAQVGQSELCGELGYDRPGDEKYYNSMSQHPLPTSCSGTSKYTQHNKTDIVVLDKIEQKCLIIDITCPFYILGKDREWEYWELPRPKAGVETDMEIAQPVTVVPVIIGALWTVSKDIEKCFAETGVTCRLESLQTACLLGRARILRKILDT